MVGAVAGGVVYPRSPLRVVPAAELLYVPDRTTNELALPIAGDVAAPTPGAILKSSADDSSPEAPTDLINLLTDDGILFPIIHS